MLHKNNKKTLWHDCNLQQEQQELPFFPLTSQKSSKRWEKDSGIITVGCLRIWDSCQEKKNWSGNYFHISGIDVKRREREFCLLCLWIGQRINRSRHFRHTKNSTFFWWDKLSVHLRTEDWQIKTWVYFHIADFFFAFQMLPPTDVLLKLSFLLPWGVSITVKSTSLPGTRSPKKQKKKKPTVM